VSVLVLFGWVALAQAEPLDLRQVAADAQWVAHNDVDLMRASPVIEKAYQAVCEQWPDQAEGQTDRLHDDFGLDLQNGLHSITAYGKQIGKPTGVLIAQIDGDKGVLEGKLKDAPGYEASEHGKYTLHSFTQEGKGCSMTLAVYSPTKLVVGRSVADVAAAIDVLDGKAPNLTKTKSVLAAKVPADAMLVGRAIGLSHAKVPEKSPLVNLVKQSDSFCVAFGIKDEVVFVDAELAVKNAETAVQFKNLADGSRAMLSLQLASMPEALKLLNLLKVNVSGKKVTANWRAPVDELWTQAEAAFAQWESTH